MLSNYWIEFIIFLFALYGLSVMVIEIVEAFKVHSQQQPKVTVILRVLNQEEVIEGVIRRIQKLNWQVGEFQLVVIDGGSIDDTLPILYRLQTTIDFEVLSESHKSSLFDLIEKNQGQLVCYLDLEKDLELLNRPEKLGKILKGIA